ncbi:hypothetical protein CC85DRAFT_277366 [Cutaneotrichosporon oleaginosum]|uniref:DUF202 domain-containing protein n=1 Tax=Cutaneotrichosporon oleaginosum TaxID=879819 RepID=A0A0J0XHM2_9TREE|nr:uncharacterized protein CC85DRAFT_277366 [Cutaneotrichosporon oleaginosum]KLT40625.1 hypothetical protein CC85DRAFT_277366 [Cutaneotrichosporon oleaginosum]TXT12435.1 hypothetical protein COLE_02845 [Cutaneotrichosporon oleaginosum]
MTSDHPITQVACPSAADAADPYPSILLSTFTSLLAIVHLVRSHLLLADSFSNPPPDPALPVSLLVAWLFPPPVAERSPLSSLLSSPLFGLLPPPPTITDFPSTRNVHSASSPAHREEGELLHRARQVYTGANYRLSPALTHPLSTSEPRPPKPFPPPSLLGLLLGQPTQRIALPVRVEPKVFFANERTFLSWLHFAVVLGGLAVGLLNFGDKIGRISAAMYTVIAVGVMVYALSVYQRRARAIRTRSGAPYDDRLGPTILCVFLLAAITTNFILRAVYE